MSANADPAALPDFVRNELVFGLAALKDARERLEAAERLDAMYRTGGRYVTEALEGANIPPLRARGEKCLAWFREHAPAQGFDAEAIIAALGGVPTFPEPSPEWQSRRRA